MFYAGEGQAGPDSLRLVSLDPAGDADLRSGQTFTHLLDFGGADAGAAINGIQFTGVPSRELLTSDQFEWSNTSGIRTQGTPSEVLPLDGPLRDLMQDYVANSLNLADGIAQIVLSDLQPGTRYRTRLYARRADSNPRRATIEFQQGDQVQSLTLDQNAPDLADPDAPYAVEYEFEAVGTELVIRATQHDGTRPWYWYALTNETAQLTGNTEVALGPTTHYFRKSFTFAGDPTADHELQLRLYVDDGAAVYLNGVEIYRDNLPSGELQYGTSALVDVAQNQQRELVTLPATGLRFGEPNVLAVEVHQTTSGDPDLRFGAELAVVQTPRPPSVPPPLRLNELPSSQASQRWVELINVGDAPVDLASVALEWQDAESHSIPLPNRQLEPQSVLAIELSASDPRWSDGDRIVLYTADRTAVADAHALADHAQARSWERAGRWLIPALSSPNQPNVFQISDAIVINEIMYHAAPQYAAGDQPFVESPQEWIELLNRGNSAVDLTGWTLDGGINFEFAAGTQIPAGGFLVVASQADVLRLMWPNVTIVGNLARSLSNQDDSIILVDPRGNPADEVHYYDSISWPAYADGGGSSLELRDPWSDNSRAESWAASREESNAPWVTITYEGLGRAPQGSADPAEWNELILGLLDAGEFLLDDVSVIEDPEGLAIERMQNGTFESSADHWRFLGTHGQHGLTQVVADPDQPDNHVLHVVATGATEHMSNHLETTFVDNARISSAATYRISFRARWLSGSPQVNSRLYFNRLAATHILPQPERAGTPGQPNSQLVANTGPTFDGLQHSPVVPRPGQAVTVSVAADDPDGLQQMQLFYAQDRAPFQSAPMTMGSDGLYRGTIPGFSSRQIVQFYVEATDQRGVTSQYPAAGPDSRAMYRVDDGLATAGPRHNLRIIMTTDDLNEQFTRTNFTSNERFGATVIWQETQVYYDVEVRLKGSGFSRGSAATGFNLRFAPDQLLFGEHDQVSIDRQGGPWGIGASHRELTIKHIANRAGDIPMMYDDVIDLIGPRDSLNGSAQFLVARYDDVFLESQYENGGDGTRFKYELIYYSTLTVDGDPESLKFPPSSSRAGVFPVRGVDLTYMGSDPDAYRWYYLIRNNRDRDDYSRIIALMDALRTGSSTVGGQLDQLSQQVMDVDQWMRLFAFESLAGINDTYNQGLEHNLQFYVRPSDQRVLAFPWDMDFALHQPTNMGIYGTGSRFARVINIPTNQRVFQQHLWDILQTTYREDYLDPWVRHLATRAQQDNTGEILNYIRARRVFVLSRLDRQIPFEITTPNKDDLQVDTPHATLEGRGWIDVRQVRLAGQAAPLTVRWLDRQRWQVTVPLEPGTQTLELQAFDLQGNSVGSATATVTTSAASPLAAGLRITELNYHPADPSVTEQLAGWSDSEDFEFIELTNVGLLPLDLSGVRFVRDLANGQSEGIAFDFPSREMPPGESWVIVPNAAAFAARYGDAIEPLGNYSGRLANGGEQLTLLGPGGEILQQFRYQDDWYPETDGDGKTLEIRSPQTTALDDWGMVAAWMASQPSGGTPGRAALVDLNRDGQLTVDDIDLFCAALQDQNPSYDLDDDQDVDEDDLAFLVISAMHSRIGDVNLDGRFDSTDLVEIFQRGEYEDTIAGNSTYADGDWNCDGDFDSRDLVFAFQYGGYEVDL